MIFACDTETTMKQIPSVAYLAGFVPVSDAPMRNQCSVFAGKYAIAEMLEGMFNQEDGSIFYFHNLKFDYSYIANVLHNDRRFAQVVRDEMITGLQHKLMRVKLTLAGKYIVLQDSYIVFYQGLRAMMRSYGDFKKGSKTYKRMKLKTAYDEYVPEAINPHMLDYFRDDMCCLSLALSKRLELGRGKLTTGADAKEIIEELTEQDFGEGSFANFFPKLDYGLDAQLRKAYGGGYVMVNPIHQAKIIKKVNVFDVNSWYPSIMLTKKLPFGKPIPFDGKPADTIGRLFIVKVILYNCSIKEGQMPFLYTGRRNDYGSKEYTEFTSEEEDEVERTVYLTNMELELFYKLYIFDKIKFCGGFYFKGTNKVFANFVRLQMQIKENSVGAERDVAKRFANTPSGKWGQNPNMYKAHTEIHDNIMKIVDDGIDRQEKAFYVPVSIFITAYGRTGIIELISKLGDKFVYCDTDSIHALISDEEAKKLFPIHPTKLGCLKKEECADLAVYLRPKRYMQQWQKLPFSTVKKGFANCSRYWDSPELVRNFRCSGIPPHIGLKQCASVYEFREGKAFTCIQGKQVEGGIQLKKIVKRI